MPSSSPITSTASPTWSGPSTAPTCGCMINPAFARGRHPGRGEGERRRYGSPLIRAGARGRLGFSPPWESRFAWAGRPVSPAVAPCRLDASTELPQGASVRVASSPIQPNRPARPRTLLRDPEQLPPDRLWPGYLHHGPIRRAGEPRRRGGRRPGGRWDTGDVDTCDRRTAATARRPRWRPAPSCSTSAMWR